VWKWPVIKYKHIKIKPRICILFILCLTWMVNANSLKQNIIVIKEICSWLPPFCKENLLFIQPKWQLRRTYYFNHYNVLFEFAFTVHVKRKINSIQILGFILICLYFTTGHFHTCVLCKEYSLFPFNSWLSFQRLCRLLSGFRLAKLNLVHFCQLPAVHVRMIRILKQIFGVGWVGTI